MLARLPEIIKQDTIVNLSPANAVWLVMISLTLSLCFVFASVLKTRYLTCAFNRYSPGRSSLWVFFVASDVLFTFITFVVALAAAPQLFYTYYRLIIPGLPFQWVFADVDFKRALDVLAINQAEVLSKLSMGLLLSTLLVTICWSWVLLNPLYKNWADDRT